MAGPTITNSMLGGTYAFKSLNANDTVYYQGVMVGVGITYALASQYRPDILAYNQACRQSDPTIPEDPSQINSYFLIQLSDSSGTQTIYSFSNLWVVSGSWQSLNTVNTVIVKVLDPNSNSQGILDALASQGYPNATIQSVTSVSSSS